MEQQQANQASYYEAMRQRADAEKTYLEQHHEEILQQTLDRQSALAKQYEEMRKRAEEQRAYLQQHHEEFLKKALKRQSEIAERQKEMYQRAMDQHASIAEKRAKMYGLSPEEYRNQLIQERNEIQRHAEELSRQFSQMGPGNFPSFGGEPEPGMGPGGIPGMNPAFGPPPPPESGFGSDFGPIPNFGSMGNPTSRQGFEVAPGPQAAPGFGMDPRFGPGGRPEQGVGAPFMPGMGPGFGPGYGGPEFGGEPQAHSMELDSEPNPQSKPSPTTQSATGADAATHTPPTSNSGMKPEADGVTAVPNTATPPHK
jgi:hypothetical protein